MIEKKLRISFCIVCRNRLDQLKETLLKNIEDNEDYSNLEFLILNYNSQDEMHSWVKRNLQKYIKAGRINYYRTTDPVEFSHSHSKNIAFNLANGALLCNINADHFTGKGFAAYINSEFTKDENIVLTTIDYYSTKKDYRVPRDLWGRVCLKKDDFIMIRGFDEEMDRYAYEDFDFVNRLEMAGVKRVLIENPSFLKYLSHSEEKRYSLNNDAYIIKYTFINYINPCSSEFIFLYQDHHFERGTLVDNFSANSHDFTYAYKTRIEKYEYDLKGNEFMKGNWNENNNEIRLVSQKGGHHVLVKNSGEDKYILRERKRELHFYKINDQISMELFTRFNYIFHNRIAMQKNIAESRIKVNMGGFGKAKIYKNFDPDQYIY